MKIRSILLTTTLFTGTVSCTATYASTTVEFWHAFSGTNGEAVSELAKQFNESQSDYVLEPVYTGKYDEGTTKLQAAIAGNTAPGLVMLEITRYGLFAARGALEPLDQYFTEAGESLTSSIRPFALEASRYLGESYVVPFNVSTPVMYYNKDAFRAASLDPERPPATWDELLEAARQLTIRDGDTVTQWGISAPPQWVRWAMANQAGGGWVDPANNEVQIDGDEAVAAYDFAAQWVKTEKVASLDGALDEDVADASFLAGQTAIEMNSTGGLTRKLNDVSFDLGVAPLPCNVKCAAPIGGATLGIVASAPNEVRAGAWEFIKFVTTPETNAFIFTATGYLPIIKGALDTQTAAERIAEHPEYLTANKQLDVAFARARPPAMPAIRDAEVAVWQSIVLDEQSADEALSAFADDMRSMIELN